MKQLWKWILLGIGIVLGVPVVITVGMSGKATVLEGKSVDFEKYIPIILCQQIDWNYEDETLKAQAVLARSSLYLCIKEKGISSQEWQAWMQRHRKLKKLDCYKEAYERMQKAVEETAGQVLVYEGEVCEGIFHKVSSGYTRDGVENLQDIDYAYLERVKSEADIHAKEYLHGHYFSEEALKIRIVSCYPEVVWTKERIVEEIVLERDASGYVTRVILGNLEVSGEEFRVNLELSSSNFSIQEMDGRIRFLCNGLGHGMGMSQFGANALAKEGNTYQTILAYYFPKTTIEKVDLQ